jgi:prephenate dehydratase
LNRLLRKPRVAFQGERGAFSEEAALTLLGPEIELVPRKTFADLFKSLEKQLADYLLAPVENTIAGVVQPSVELLRSSSLSVLDEVEIKIEQHLIGCPGASFETIETVHSHPVALAQCSRFFANNPQLKPIVADDTAGSVAEVVRLRDPKRAAIAGRRAAELYGATVIRQSIQDQTENYTRFVLLSASRERNESFGVQALACLQEQQPKG